MTTKRKAFPKRTLWRLIIALLLAVSLGPVSAAPVAALTISDYFSYSYTVQFSKSQVAQGETFDAIVQVTATYIKAIPLLGAPSEASSTGRIVGTHQTSGVKVTLNPSYTVTVSPFPSLGQTTQMSQVVPLRFPDGSQPGTYMLAGELIEAQVNVAIFGWISVKDLLPQSQNMGPVTFVSSSAGVPGGGGAPPAPAVTTSPGVTEIGSAITDNGKFIQEVVARSQDGKVTLVIPRDTTGKNVSGGPLRSLTISPMKEPPPRAPDSSVIGLVYDIDPSGATFDPPVTVTFRYDDSQIPPGIAEKRLVIATWDSARSQWVDLASSVEPDTNIIVAKVSHFSAFTVLAHTRPASFTLSGLTITPAEVNLGDRVNVSAVVTNTGDVSDVHRVNLQVDGLIVQMSEFKLAGGEAVMVTFSMTADSAGRHTLNVGNLLGTFEVKVPVTPGDKTPAPSAVFATSNLSIAPAEVSPGQTVTISVTVANTGDLGGTYRATLRIDGAVIESREVALAGGAKQEITFTTTPNAAGTHNASFDGLNGEFVVRSPASFAVSNLSIAPAEVSPGQTVTISVTVANTGDLGGTYRATLRIDGAVFGSREVTLAGGAKEEITFTTTPNAAGTHNASFDGLNGEFVVRSPPLSLPSILSGWRLIAVTGVAAVVLALIIWLMFSRRR